jgi:hypothetical protein
MMANKSIHDVCRASSEKGETGMRTLQVRHEDPTIQPLLIEFSGAKSRDVQENSQYVLTALVLDKYASTPMRDSQVNDVV